MIEQEAVTNLNAKMALMVQFASLPKANVQPLHFLLQLCKMYSIYLSQEFADSGKFHCFLTTVDTLTLFSHFIHLLYEIPIHYYRRNRWHLLILFWVAQCYFIWFVNITLTKCRNLSPSLLRNTPKPKFQHYSYPCNIMADLIYQHHCLLQSWQQRVRALWGVIIFLKCLG